MASATGLRFICLRKHSSSAADRPPGAEHIKISSRRLPVRTASLRPPFLPLSHHQVCQAGFRVSCLRCRRDFLSSPVREVHHFILSLIRQVSQISNSVASRRRSTGSSGGRPPQVETFMSDEHSGSDGQPSAHHHGAASSGRSHQGDPGAQASFPQQRRNSRRRQTATDWQPHTVRVHLTCLRKAGHPLVPGWTDD